MTPDEDRTDYSVTRIGPVQFSLQTLLLVTTGLAVCCSLLLVAPSPVRVVTAGCLLITLPALLTVVLIYRRTYARTFCIAALFPSGLLFWEIQTLVQLLYVYGGAFGQAGPMEAGYWPAMFVAVQYGLSLVIGLLAVFVRWKLENADRLRAEERSGQVEGTDSSQQEWDQSD
ncbi:MAG: hypothetical protein HQ567_28150 [Candidatus Nealsonbacteria bacterium]|nr:hypothetical protein [Candidatus Nealsonbacteria bacterium]